MSSKKSIWRVSGQRFEIPVAATQATDEGWKFSLRPGGMWMAERSRPDGSIERKRVIVESFRGKMSAWVSGRLLVGDLSEVRMGAEADEGSDADLIAQFPGRIRKIVVAPGQSVASGEILVLVEAKKMEFAVKAPFAGKVTRILVQEGQTLSPGTRYCDLEKSKKA